MSASSFFLFNPTASPLPRGFDVTFACLSLHKVSRKLDDCSSDRPSKRFKLASAPPRPRIPRSSFVHGYRARRSLAPVPPRTLTPIPVYYQMAWSLPSPAPPPPPPAPVPTVPMDIDSDPSPVDTPMDVNPVPRKKTKKTQHIKVLTAISNNGGGAHRTIKRSKRASKENTAPYPSTARLKGRRRA